MSKNRRTKSTGNGAALLQGKGASHKVDPSKMYRSFHDDI